MDSFIVATFNVNSIRSRLHVVIPWLEANRPRFFCMQETKVSDDEFPLSPFEDQGYHVVFRGEKRYNGVAVASLEKPGHFSAGFDDGEPPDEDRLICARYDDLTILNIYVPQGRSRDHEQFRYKLRWFERLLMYLERNHSPDEPLLCCGDLNIAPEEIDVHDPKRLLGHVDFNPEVWEAFDRLKAWGLEDVFRRHHPGEPGRYTFFDYRVPDSLGRGLGWRIDHILATPPLSSRSADSFIDLETRAAERPSDHAVLAARFHWCCDG